jgi:hypothetical protein
MPKKQFNLWSQIPLKHLIDSVRCHVSANKRTTRALLNKKYIYIYKYTQIKNYFKQNRKKKAEEENINGVASHPQRWLGVACDHH